MVLTSTSFKYLIIHAHAPWPWAYEVLVYSTPIDDNSLPSAWCETSAWTQLHTISLPPPPLSTDPVTLHTQPPSARSSWSLPLLAASCVSLLPPKCFPLTKTLGTVRCPVASCSTAWGAAEARVSTASSPQSARRPGGEAGAVLRRAPGWQGRRSNCRARWRRRARRGS